MSVLPVIPVDRRRIGVNRSLAGPLVLRDYQREPGAMLDEAAAFARRERHATHPRVHWRWDVVAWLPVWQVPYAEPQVLQHEDGVAWRDEVPGYYRLRALERDVIDGVVHEMLRLNASPERDSVTGDIARVQTRWTARLEVSAYAIPASLTAEDRDEFARLVQGLPTPLPERLVFAPTTTGGWRG